MKGGFVALDTMWRVAVEDELAAIWEAGSVVSPLRARFLDPGCTITEGLGRRAALATTEAAPVQTALARAMAAPRDDLRFGAARFLGR